MRIVHLCSMDFGGAGKAAYRLHKGLQEIGVDSSMVVMCKKTSDDSVYALPSEVSNSPEKWWGLLTNIWERSLTYYPLRPADNELFSAFYAAIPLGPLQEIIRSADIINLHWVAGFFNASLMPSILLNKKIVWTLHDMNPFTGGCHYAGECIRYHDSCGACPQLASDDPKDLSFSGWTLKQQGYRNLDITVVTPSRWLGICSEKSSLLGRFSHKIIPYGFPLSTFKPLDRHGIRSALNIAPDAQIVLFCADSTATKRKGFSYLLDALAQLFASGRGKNLTLAVVGSYDSNRQDACAYPVLSFGHIGDEEQMTLLYNAADVFVLPSLEDNLPNTVVEALACGTPVAAFNIGGVPDMVTHGITGYLAPAKDVAGLADAIEWCVNYAPAEIRHSCRAQAEEYFALETQANNYKKLYDSITAKAANQVPGVFIKKTAPKISIVTPSFNQAEYLEECIESILSQNYPNLEYIIMDGGSTDGSVDIIKKYEKHLAYWQSKPDGGQYQAINEGFRRSSGEIMCWLNSDDKLHSGALHQVELAFRAMPQTEWITGRPTAWDDQGRLITVFDHVPSWSLERLLYHGKDDYYIQQESTFWRRSLWDRAGGGLDTNWQLAADFELWCRFFNYSELTGVDALFGGFRYHSGQKTDTMMDRYEQEVLQIIERERTVSRNTRERSQSPNVVGMGEIISATTPQVTPDNFSCFSFSRRFHFNWFEAYAAKLFGSRIDPDYCDLKMYQDLLCYAFILDNFPKGARLLEVGGGDSRVLKALKHDYECWNVDKLEGLGNGLTEVKPDGYRMVQAYLGDFSRELPDGYFDFVFSISALEHVAENEENFNNICHDMDRVMKPGAYSLHCFDVVVKPDSVWTNILLPFLYNRYETRNRFIPFDQMVQDPSLYCMTEAAYERGWRNITKVPYKEFGRPLSCNILWRKSLDQPDSILPSLQDISLVASRELFSCGLYEEEFKKTGYSGGGGQAEEPARVVVATSIAPGNTERQQKAIQSWLDNGFKVISVNIPGEIELLKGSFPDVTFVKAERDGREQYGRPLVFLDEVFSALAATGFPVCGIINSDICLTFGIGIRDYISHEAQGAFVISHRIDVDRTETAEGTVYRNGFDVFFFSRDLCSFFPPSEFCLGTTWWDIWAPLVMILKGVPVKQLITPLAYHVTHDNRWNENEWYANCDRIITMICTEANGATEHAELVESARIPLNHKDYIDFFSVIRDYILLKAEKISLYGDVESLEHQKSVTTKMQEGISVPRTILVSAIVSTYNAEKFFSGCLANLFGQTIYEKGQLEIIIINSGSEQNEEGIARRCMETHDHIVYERTERETLYAAWNRAINLAKGKYIVNANTDDTLRGDALELLAAALDTHHEADLAYGDCALTREPNDSFTNHHAYHISDYPLYNPALGMMFCLLGPHPMWRKALFNEIGMFDPSYRAAGDYEFQMRFIMAGRSAVHVLEVLSLFCQNAEGLSLASETSSREAVSIESNYRSIMPINRLYEFDSHSPASMADAWVAQGNLSLAWSCPWLEHAPPQLYYAASCYRKALEVDRKNKPALQNLCALMAVQSNWGMFEYLLECYTTENNTLKTHLSDKTRPDFVRVEVKPASKPLVFTMAPA